MRRIAWIPVFLTVFFGTTGCITGRVAHAAGKWRRPHGEILTATSPAQSEGAIYGVVALEAECRVTPGDPEGGPGAASYSLVRTHDLAPEEKQFLERKGLDPVAVYRSEGDHEAPPGFPKTVLVGEKSSDDGAIFVQAPGGWQEEPVTRYVHRDRSRGHAFAATLVEAVTVPFTLVLDLATFPIQWLLAPWYPITPP